MNLSPLMSNLFPLPVPFSIARAACAGMLALASFAAAANPLKALQEGFLKDAQRAVASATTVAQQQPAVEAEVAALNSLGRSAEALQRLDAWLAATPGAKANPELRAKVLLSLGRCDEELPALQARVLALDEAQRKLAADRFKPDSYLLGGSETLLAVAYCHLANRRWDEANLALARVLDPFDPSLLQYTAAWYVGLRALGAKPHPALELAAVSPFVRPSVHAISLSLAQRRMPPAQAFRDLGRLNLGRAAQQDGTAELTFFAGLLARSPEEQAQWLAALDELAPYGSAEWMLAKILFKSN
jgi:tetratricopeptide (TPR) repeat protein